MIHRLFRIAAALVAAMLLASSLAGAASAGRADLTALRSATARFHSLTQAARAGYGQPPAGVPLRECISSFDGSGSMGFHYINGGLLDDVVDASKPEVLVYAPDSTGELRLVALEFVIFQDAWLGKHPGTMPELFGTMFMATGSPNRFEIPAFFSLHVWLYQNNPAGMFAPFNPTVSCAGAASATRGGSTTAAVSIQTAAATLTPDRASRWQCAISATA